MYSKAEFFGAKLGLLFLGFLLGKVTISFLDVILRSDERVMFVSTIEKR